MDKSLAAADKLFEFGGIFHLGKDRIRGGLAQTAIVGNVFLAGISG